MYSEMAVTESAVPDLNTSERPTCRVAVLSLHTSPLESPGGGDAGGLNVYVMRVAEQMAANGVECDIFTRRINPDAPEITEVAPGIRVINIHAGPERGLHKDLLRTLVGRFAAGIERFSAVNGPYEVIHAHYWLSGLAGLRLRDALNIPLVMTFHTLARVKDATRGDDAAEPLFRRGAEDQIVRRADVLVAATDIERDQLVTEYDADPRKVRVVNPGVDLDLFKPSDRSIARQVWGMSDAPTILFVGRIQKLKGPHIAIGALARLKKMVPDAELLIVGDESPRTRFGERQRLRLLVRTYRVARRVRFLDPVPHAELPSLMSAADVVVIPSASESFGLVALEAAACGTPVVATNVGGLRRLVVDDETGCLVDRRTASGFARALSRVLADPATRQRLGDNARRLASNFPWSATARGLVEAYASVTACEGVRRALLARP